LTHTPQKNSNLFMVDVDKFEKIFYNLLSNAFKFTSAGGTIAISYRYKQESGITWYSFRISDTGIGMREEETSKVFDRFYKVDDNDGGAGVGLALTFSLVQLMEGNIHVESNLGEGSDFEVTLPLEP